MGKVFDNIIDYLKNAVIYNQSTPAAPNGGGKIYTTATSDWTGIMATRTDTTAAVTLEVGTGGYNHGVYSESLSKWLIHSNSNSNKSFLLGNLPLDVSPVTTVSSVITLNSSVAKASEFSAVQWGKIASIYLKWVTQASISVPASGDISDLTVGTLVSGWRPAIPSSAHSNGDGGGEANYFINTTGAFQLFGLRSTGTAFTLASGTTLYAHATYILA